MQNIERVRRWYEGESKLHVYDNSPDSAVWVAPSPYTEYHWTAKLARVLVGFYLRHWQWIWSTILAILGLYLAALALK